MRESLIIFLDRNVKKKFKIDEFLIEILILILTTAINTLNKRFIITTKNILKIILKYIISLKVF